MFSVLSDDDYRYRILGIDNGTEKLGVVINDHDLRTGISTIVYGRVFRASRIAYDRHPGRLYARGELPARLDAIERYLYDILDEYDPDVVGCESPFSHLHAHSYGALLTSMNRIDETVYRYRGNLPFIRVPPGKAKKAACPPGKYKDDKAYIRECILKDPRITASCGVVLEDLEEDAMDAVAVSRYIAYLEEIR